MVPLISNPEQASTPESQATVTENVTGNRLLTRLSTPFPRSPYCSPYLDIDWLWGTEEVHSVGSTHKSLGRVADELIGTYQRAVEVPIGSQAVLGLWDGWLATSAPPPGGRSWSRCVSSSPSSQPWLLCPVVKLSIPGVVCYGFDKLSHELIFLDGFPLVITKWLGLDYAYGVFLRWLPLNHRLKFLVPTMTRYNSSS